MAVQHNVKISMNVNLQESALRPATIRKDLTCVPVLRDTPWTLIREPAKLRVSAVFQCGKHSQIYGYDLIFAQF